MTEVNNFTSALFLNSNSPLYSASIPYLIATLPNGFSTPFHKYWSFCVLYHQLLSVQFRSFQVSITKLPLYSWMAFSACSGDSYSISATPLDLPISSQWIPQRFSGPIALNKT